MDLMRGGYGRDYPPDSSSPLPSPSADSSSSHCAANNRPFPWDYHSPMNSGLFHPEPEPELHRNWAPGGGARGGGEVEGRAEIGVGQWGPVDEGEGAAGRSRRAGESAGTGVGVEREHMFDKVVTPSDVGKLNRLVIPKQHAEKYFPLDSTTHEKGLHLNFEDRSGKQWRFRYSYWNSSQSYVMTKGWSRFVKDKRLDAGDVVSFQRGVGEEAKDRLYIDWRRRPHAVPREHVASGSFLSPRFSPHLPSTPLYWRPPTPPAAARPWDYPQTQDGGRLVFSAGGHTRHQLLLGHHHPHQNGVGYSGGSYGLDGAAATPNVYGQWRSGGGIPQPPRGLASGGTAEDGSRVQQQEQSGEEGEGDDGHVHMAVESAPAFKGKAACSLKRLRLFGVNMDCPIPPSELGCDVGSSFTASQNQPEISASRQSHIPPPAAVPGPFHLHFLHTNGAPSPSSPSFDSRTPHMQ